LNTATRVGIVDRSPKDGRQGAGGWQVTRSLGCQIATSASYRRKRPQQGPIDLFGAHLVGLPQRTQGLRSSDSSANAACSDGAYGPVPETTAGTMWSARGIRAEPLRDGSASSRSSSMPGSIGCVIGGDRPAPAPDRTLLDPVERWLAAQDVHRLHRRAPGRRQGLAGVATQHLFGRPARHGPGALPVQRVFGQGPSAHAFHQGVRDDMLSTARPSIRPPVMAGAISTPPAARRRRRQARRALPAH